MATLKQIITLTPTQYNTLITNGQITAGGHTYTYDTNTLYFVPDENESNIKYDTAANWALETSYVPPEGEIIFYASTTPGTAPQMKVGDGLTTVENLPFVETSSINGHTILSDVPANAVFTDTKVEVIRL